MFHLNRPLYYFWMFIIALVAFWAGAKYIIHTEAVAVFANKELILLQKDFHRFEVSVETRDLKNISDIKRLQEEVRKTQAIQDAHSTVIKGHHPELRVISLDTHLKKGGAK